MGGLGVGVAQSPLKSLTSCAMRRLPDKAWRIPKTSVVGRSETDFCGNFGEFFRGEFWRMWVSRFFGQDVIYIYICFWGIFGDSLEFFLNVYMFDYLGRQFVGKRGTDAQMNEICR